MALTQTEFQSIKNRIKAWIAVGQIISKMMNLLRDIESHTDPSNSLNSDMTLIRINQLYGTNYSNLKSQLQAEINNLP